MRKLAGSGPQQEKIFQRCRHHAVPLGRNHNESVAGVKLGLERRHHGPLGPIAPQLLVPHRQGGFAEVQCPRANSVLRRERLAEKPTDFCALGFGAMAPDDDADLHASAQAARLSLNNVSVRSLASLAAVAS